MSKPHILLAVARHIEDATKTPVEVETHRAESGGCINDAWTLGTTSGQTFFVKSNSDAPADMFPAEADGLREMAATRTLRVPKLITMGSLESGESFLVLEAVQTGRPAGDFFETFGRNLAAMHRQGSSDQFGFDSDNWLGSSIQLNPRMTNWNEFWTTTRLIPQLAMAQDNGVSNRKLQQLGNRLVNRIETFLGPCEEPPSLIHGDLWNGNFLSDKNGQPVIFDPACYYANREAEFGMTTLFGGFPSQFYAAYDEAWPLAEGWKSRAEIYRLYHLLNHLNLFGSGYLSGCLEILMRYA